MGKSSEQKSEEENEKQYDLYYAVFYNEPRDVCYLLKQGARENYKIPGKEESAVELAKRLDSQGKLSPEIKKMLKL